MEDSQPRSNNKEPSSSSQSKTIETRGSELAEPRVFRGRSRSAERLSAAPESTELEILQSQLESEIKAKHELQAKVIRLNADLSQLQATFGDCTREKELKEDIVHRLESIITEERNRQVLVSNHYTSLLKDKEVKIQELIRGHEGEMMSKHEELEQHSRVAQDIHQILERERREWRNEKEFLQSELDGTRQLLHEQEMETSRKRQDTQEAMERFSKLKEEFDVLQTEYEAQLSQQKQIEDLTLFEVEFQAKEAEIRQLRSQLSRVTETIKDNQNKTDNEILSLKRSLAEAYNERDLLKKELQEQHHQPTTLPPIVGDEELLAETCSRLETQLEELRVELDEERELLLSVQSRLEDQLQINTQLESENVQLRSTINKEASELHNRQISNEAAEALRPNLLQLQETLSAAQAQIVGLGARRGSRLDGHSLSTLNITIQEAQHQLEAMTSSVEAALGFTPGETGELQLAREASPKRRRFSIERRFKSLFRSSTTTRKNKGEKSTKKLKMEIEDLRKECVNLLRENFSLEQCIRYLSARCQLYQTFHFAREGGQHRRSVTERVVPIRGSYSVRGRPLPSASEHSGEIHQLDPVSASGGVLPEPRSEDREASGSSSSGGGQVLDGASTLSRSVEVKILHKISSICEPFSQLSDNSLVMSGLFASSRASYRSR